MDINGTQFHLRTGEDDWEPLMTERQVDGLWWDRERQSLGLLPQIMQFGQRSSETPLKPADRRGAARDLYGNIYWIDNNRKQIQVLPAGIEQVGTYWSTMDLNNECHEQDESDLFRCEMKTVDVDPVLSGLTITCQHYLVVGTLAPSGLLVFDLHAGGTPGWLRWPAEIPFSPLDLCAAADGGVWILDRDMSSDNAFIWRLDRYLRLVSVNDQYEILLPANEDIFKPEGGEARVRGPRYVPQPTSMNTGSPILAHNATAIECLGDESVLILAESETEDYSVIHRFRQGLETNRVELQGGILEQMLSEPQLLVHDFVFVVSQTELPGTVAGTLTVVVRNGNQAFAFDLLVDGNDLDIRVLPRYLPLRRFSGKALLPTPDGAYYDMDQRWYLVTEQPRRRYISEEVIDGLEFDGKQPGCVWHRIVIDGCVPTDTAITIYSRADDEKSSLAYHDWQAEPALVLRSDGPEIVLHEPFNDDERELDGTGTWELLVQNAIGRHLELRIQFSGNGRASPRIRALRVYYPRFSYLEKYLPAIYREQPVSAEFVDRYLANTEGFFTVLEQRIAAFQNMLDTRTAPADYLEWLAGWLGALLSPRWSDARRRLFVDNAVLLFRWRGTQIGMRALLRLGIDPCPDETIFDELREGQSFTPIGGAAGNAIRIIERFLYRQLPGVVIGDPTVQGGLRLTSASTDLSELGKPWTLNKRYQDFLLARYKQRVSDTYPTALDVLNVNWHTEYTEFSEIEFTTTIPDSVYQQPDWLLFVRRELAVVGAWQPEQGVWALHIRYQEWLRKRYEREYAESALTELNDHWQSSYTGFDQISFSPILPSNENRADDWQRFIREGLGFIYAPVTDQDVANYREFLARRYQFIDYLNQTYNLTGDSAWSAFSAIELPPEDAMPSSPAALHDWIQFVSLTLPIRRNAHRFTVLVPTEPGELPQSRDRRLAQVEEIVQREKPAHTDFDVRLYWALFQVGSARLGLDTTLGSGARYVAIVLGTTYLGQGVLEHGHPWDIRQRQVIGRDRVQRSIRGENDNE